MRNKQRALHAAIVLLLAFTFLLPAAPAALAQEQATATIHYFRPDGDYTDWGLHTWEDAAEPTDWASPLPPTGESDFGVYWEVPLKPDGAKLGLIVHRGDEKDPGNDMFLDLTAGSEAWIVSGDPLLYTQQPDPSAKPNGDINKLRAHWISRDTVAYPAPEELPADAVFEMLDAFNGGMQLTVEGIMGGGLTRTPLTVDEAGLPAAVLEKFPHLDGYLALKLPEAKLKNVPALLKGQLAVQVTSPDGALIDATGIQLPGVIDELYTYDGPLEPVMNS